jgi:IPT/TIG domain
VCPANEEESIVTGQRRNTPISRALTAAAVLAVSAGSAVVPLHPAAASTSPDFTVSFSPGPTFNPGSSGTLTATVNGINGETGSVVLVPLYALGVNTTAPVGAVTASPAAAPVSVNNGQQQFTLSANANAVLSEGSYNEVFEATDESGTTHSYSVPFTIAGGYADFSLSPSTTALTIPAGTSATMSTTVNALNNFSAPVDLTVNPRGDGPSQAPPYGTWTTAGRTGSGAPVDHVPGPYPSTEQLTVTVPAQTAPGLYTLAVTGASTNSQSATHAFVLSISVVANPALPTYTLSLSSCPTFNPGTQTSFTATVTPRSGETGPVTLTPTQGQMQVVPPTATVGGAGTLVNGSWTQTFTVSENAKVGAWTQVVDVEGVDAHGITFLTSTPCTSTTTPADFTLSAAATTLTIQQGQQTTDDFVINAANGMNSDIQMTAVPTTPPPTSGAVPLATWGNGAPITDVAKQPDPSTQYPTQHLTIAVSSEVPVGTYTVRVDSQSYNAASLEQTVTLTIKVVPGTGDYTLSLSAGPTFNAGSSGTFTATVTLLGSESVPITVVPAQGPWQITPPVWVLTPPLNGTAFQPFPTSTYQQTFTISANAHVPQSPLGQYPVPVVAVDGHGFVDREQTSFTLTSTPADFTITPSPAGISVAQTYTGSTGVAITPSNGMHDHIQLSVARGTDNTTPLAPSAAWPGGAPAVDVTVNPDGTYSTQTLTFATTANTPLGTYHYVVTATSANSATASQSRDVYVTVTSGALDFYVTFSNGPTFNPGTNAGITATVHGINGDNEPVDLIPDQGAVVVSPQQTQATPGQSASFTLVSNANTPPCSCTFAVTAVGEQTHQAHRSQIGYTLTTTPASYSLGATSSSLTIPVGGGGSTGVTVIPANGMQNTVALGVVPAADVANGGRSIPVARWQSGSGGGTPVTTVAPNGGTYATQTLSFVDPPSDRGGTYHYTVIATSGNAKPAQQVLDLYVTVPWPTFTLTATPVPAVNPGSSQSFTVTAHPVAGDSSTVTLVAQQAPGTISPAQTSISAAGGAASFTLAVDARMQPGSYQQVITGVDQNGNAVPISIPFNVTTAPAYFAVSAAQDSVPTHPGTNASLPVSVTPYNGMTGNVQLVITPAPDASKLVGPVATWSNGSPEIDTAVSSTQWVTFNVPTTTLPGQYHYRVTGFSPNASPPTWSIDLYLSVSAPATDGFDITVPASIPAFNPGTSQTITVPVATGPAETTSIQLVASQGPATVSPASVALTPPYPSSVTFTITSAAQQPGNTAYPLVIAGFDQNGHAEARPTTYPLTGTPAAFTVSAPADPVSVANAQSSTATAIVTPLNGFSGAVTLAVGPVAASTSVTAGGAITPDANLLPLVTWHNGGGTSTSVSSPYPAQALDIKVGTGVPAGTYPFTIAATSGNAMPPVATTTFSVVVPGPGGSAVTPSVVSVSPTTGDASGGQMVTVKGTNFLPGQTGVNFGSAPGTAVTVSDPSTLTVTAPALCSGTYDVTVSTPVGTSAQSSSDRFAVRAAQPTITSITPSTGSSATTTTVTVTGTNLVCAGSAKVVQPSLRQLSAAVLADPMHPNTPQQVQVAIPPQPHGTTGDLVITTAGGDSLTVPGDIFRWVASPPQLTTVTPSTGPARGGEAVVLRGLGMSFATSVLFGGTPSPSVTVNSDPQVTAIAPAGCGSVPVTVTTSAGVSLSATFTYVNGVPVVSGLSPSDGPTAGGNQVDIVGSNFLCSSGVAFGSQAVGSFHVDSDTRIRTTAPPGAAGVMDVTVTNAAGRSATSLADEYEYEGVPVVASVVPDAGPASGGTALTITGQNFTGRSSVSVGGGIATAVTDIDSVSLQATTPAGSGGPVDVVVSDGGGASARSAAAQFYYGPPVPASVSPAVGASAGGGDVRITGSNFAPDTTVRFGSQQVTATVLSATLIDVPSAPSGSPGTSVAITLQDPGGTSTGSLTYNFAYRPTVASISPNNGGASGGTAVTITGSALTASPQVFFGQSSAPSVTVNGDGTLTAVSPAGTPGASVYVTVTTVGGTSDASSSRMFTYQPPPSGTMAPVVGPLIGGTLFTISGTNFFGTVSVTFGGVAATGVTVDSLTQIHGYSPAFASPQSVSVVLTTGSGSTTVGTFTYDPVPTMGSLTSSSPNAGPAIGESGTPPNVTITGTGFLHNVSVTFDGVAAQLVSVDPSGTSLIATAPAHLPGVVDVVVSTAGGSTTPTATTKFAYGKPVVSASTAAGFAVTPPGGQLNQTQAVTITGSGFVFDTSVVVGSVSVPPGSVHVIDAHTIQATVPASATSGRQDVRVTTNAGQSAANSSDVYTYGSPVLDTLSSYSGKSAGGDSVILNLHNFVNDGVTVTVNGAVVTPTGYSIGTGTQAGQASLTILMPSLTVSSPTGVSVQVSTDGGQSNPLTYTYWPPPTVTGVSLSAGPSSGGRTVTISGSNFTAGNIRVVFGDAVVPGYNVSVPSQNMITVTTPPHGAATLDVQVTALGGTSAIGGADQYQYMDQGYDLVESNGAVHNMNAPNYGSPFNTEKPISGMAFTPDGRGYWITAQDGGVFAFGDAGFYGSMGGQPLNRPVVGIAPTPSGHGYWLVGADGGIFTFGDAGFYGGMAGKPLNRPMSGIAATNDGGGYWLVAQDGGIFTFGDAHFQGSWCCHGSTTVVGIAANTTLDGYWLAENDGQVAAMGNACCGSGAPVGNQIVSITATPTGNGYWLFATDGGVYTYGDASWQGRPSVPGTMTAGAALFAA